MLSHYTLEELKAEIQRREVLLNCSVDELLAALVKRNVNNHIHAIPSWEVYQINVLSDEARIRQLEIRGPCMLVRVAVED